jgi:hypothetical protein
MTEEPVIIEMNIARYEAMLKHELDEKERSIVERLLAQTEANLVLPIDSRKPQDAYQDGARAAGPNFPGE